MTMKFVLPIAGMMITAIATLTANVFCLGTGANSTLEQLRALKFWMSGPALPGLAGIVAGIILLRAGQATMAAGISFLPTAHHTLYNPFCRMYCVTFGCTRPSTGFQLRRRTRMPVLEVSINGASCTMVTEGW